LPYEDVMVYSAVADVAWITPLRDGLNLVAKEYVVAQDAVGGAGVLVLSEYAGAAVELHGALLTNPYDFEGLSDGLHRALELSEEERRQRLKRLALTVEQYDVGEWTREVLGAMEDPDATKPRGQDPVVESRVGYPIYSGVRKTEGSNSLCTRP
jgi:glucosylglycerol-phosphate synthase